MKMTIDVIACIWFYIDCFDLRWCLFDDDNNLATKFTKFSDETLWDNTKKAEPASTKRKE